MPTQKTLASVAIGNAIHAVIARWIGDGRITEAAEVGNGGCEEFADEVMVLLREREPSIAKDADIAWSDEWWAEGHEGTFLADIPRMRAEGMPLPDGFDDNELANLFGAMTHAWIVHEGRHYDATAPDGRAYFLGMPFFAGQIEAARTIYETCRESAA